MASTHDPNAQPGRNERPAGIRLIVAYKLVRGVIALSLGAVAAVDGGALLRGAAAVLRHHFIGAWSMRLADVLLRAAAPRALTIAALALGVDGLFTLFEAWALRRRFRWAAWLVVISTSSFLPFELFELRQSVHAGRLAIVVANVAVVIYLVRSKVRGD